ncbi:MAG: hypothetical protein K8T90_10765 [Planctomycetes bacterium]|nr:hypothetical protein [Planctomycetota bacterium]
MGTVLPPSTEAPLADPPCDGLAPDVRMAARGEDAEWFRRLPPAMQDEIRARRREADGRVVARHDTRRRSFGSGALRGGAVFLLTHLMFGYAGIVGILVAVTVGALLGLVWTWFDAGPMKSCISAGPVYATVWLATNSAGAPVYLVFFAMLIAMPFAAVAGTSREFRQGDGLE